MMAYTPPPIARRRWFQFRKLGNDPSAGSPTETLLRLLLPLNDQVRTSSQSQAAETARVQSNVLAKPFNR
jgi:hypothetical protein